MKMNKIDVIFIFAFLFILFLVYNCVQSQKEACFKSKCPDNMQPTVLYGGQCVCIVPPIK